MKISFIYIEVLQRMSSKKGKIIDVTVANFVLHSKFSEWKHHFQLSMGSGGNFALSVAPCSVRKSSRNIIHRVWFH
jgi:hypothetical protein